MFDDLAKIVSKAAPLIGGLLGGPAGAIVAGLVASAFGGDAAKPDELVSLIQNDPQAPIKLQEMWLNHKLELEKLSLQYALADNSDRLDARAREKEVKDKVPGILALVFTAGYLLMMLYFAWAPEISDSIIMGVTNAEMLILAYYFGSANRKNPNIPQT